MTCPDNPFEGCGCNGQCRIARYNPPPKRAPSPIDSPWFFVASFVLIFAICFAFLTALAWWLP